MANDLRHLHHLLNELQPAFKEIISSSGPNQYSPVISLEAYGPDHMVDAFPVISTTSYFGNPISLSVSGLPPGDQLYDPGSVSAPAPSADSFSPGEAMQILPLPGVDHASTLAESLVTITATDTGTGQVSNLSFNYIGPGPDPTLPNAGYPPSPKQLAVFNQYMSLFGPDPPSTASAAITWDQGMPLQNYSSTPPVGMDFILAHSGHHRSGS